MPSGETTSQPRKPIVSVVDDDSAMRAAVKDLLDSSGYWSRSFESAEQFIASDASDASAVVIADIQMGKLDGLDLLAWLSTNRELVPVILITALTDERLEQRAIGGGCFAFLRKPFDPETLLRHVRNALEVPRSRDQQG